MILSEKIAEERKKNGWSQEELAAILAGAVALCIMSPALLIFLSGLSGTTGGKMSENTAAGIGISVLLLMVSVAVAIFISYGIHGKAYEYLEKELIETAYGVKGLVKEKKQNYEGTYTRGIIMGVGLCILSVIPLLIVSIMKQPDSIITGSVSLLLLLVAAGVYLLVRVSVINGSYDMLLQEGEYSRQEKVVKKKLEIFATVYWCTATAIYLAWSFVSMRWDYTWILWPVAGVLFGAVSAVARGILGRRDLLQ